MIKIGKHQLKLIFLSLFINNNHLKPSLHIIASFIEVLIYSAIILGLPLSFLMFQNSQIVYTTIFLILTLLLGLRIQFKSSVIRAFYGVILTIAIQQFKETIAGPTLIIILLILLCIIDILSNTSFQFIQHNITAENHNIIKFLHYIIFWCGLILNNSKDKVWIDGIMMGLFLLLFIVKKTSMCYNNEYKQLLLRSYLILFFVHLAKIITIYSNLQISIIVSLSFIISQVVYYLYKTNQVQFNTEELLSRQQYVKLIYNILTYLQNQNYTQQIERQIRILIEKQQPVDIQEKEKLVYNKIINMLMNKFEFQAQIILAQVYLIHNCQILKTKLILEKEKRKLKWYDINAKIHIYRVQQSLLNTYNQKKSLIQFQNYQSYELCDQFRDLLLKSSFTFVVLWEYVKKVEIKIDKLRLVAQKAIQYQRRIIQDYEKIPQICIKLKLLYVSYLFEAARDINRAKQILENIAFNDDYEVDFKIDQKVFIKFGLEEEPLTVIRIGQNVSNLLGYQRRQIQGQKHSIFLPEFYQKQHKEIVNNFFQQNFQKLYYFSKQTIIKTKYGHYEHCNLTLCLSYSITNEIILSGYIQIVSNQSYNLFYYLFVNQQQQIIDCAENLQAMAPTKTKCHKISQFFQPRISINDPLIQYQKGNIINYTPMLKFSIENNFIIYYIRKQILNKQLPIESALFNHQIVSTLSYMFNFRLQWNFIRNYYEKMQLVLNKIKSKYYIFIIVIMIIAMISILICIAFMVFIKQQQLKLSQKQMIMSQTLIDLYNCTINLGLKTTYIDLQQIYNYSNNFVQYDVIPISLNLQELNQQFKHLSTYKYTIPFQLLKDDTQLLLYDLIVQLLSDAYTYQKMSSDQFFLTTLRSKQRTQLPYIFSDNLKEYKNNWQSEVVQISYFNYQIIIIAIQISLLILICVLIFYLEYKMRLNQKQTLLLILTIRQEQFIQNIKIFIGKITREDITSFVYQNQNMNNNNIRNNQQTFIGDLNNTTQRHSTKTQMSLKQISGRDLLGGESLNRSDILQAQQSNRNQSGSSFKIKKVNGRVSLPNISMDLTISTIKKPIIIIPIVSILLFIALAIGNQVDSNIAGKLNEKTSIKNIFQLMNPLLTYSSLSISFMNLLAIKAYQNDINFTKYNNLLNSIVFPNKNVIQFKENSFSEFSPFQTKIMDLHYKYICTYIKCDPKYTDQINIIYLSTLDKLEKRMLNLKDQLNNYSIQNLRKDIHNGSLRYQIDLLYYTQQVIRVQLIETFDIYFNCFHKYLRNRYHKKATIDKISYIILVLSGLMLLYFIYYFCKHQDSLERISKLIKTQSEINEDKLIGDYDLLKDKSIIQE